LAHIFVSYGRADRAYVDRLVGWFARAGVDAWYDKDIPTGRRWEEELEGRVETSAALLVVMSPAAGASEWVAREVARAQELGKPILPLLRDGIVLFGLDPTQFEDVREGHMPSPEFVADLRDRARLRHVLRYQVGLVPEEADCFQYRAVADDLDGALAAGKTAILTGTGTQRQILSGVGGVGKTQLAAAVARRQRAAGELDILVWISSGSRDAIVTGYAQAAAEITGADPADPQMAAEALLTHLAGTGQAWLIVLDDLADPNDLIGLWPPRTPTGRAVVTTRRRDPVLAGYGRVVSVDLFTPVEAQRYLVAKFREQSHRLAEASELAKDLGLLPVALAQAAAYVAERDLTCAQYRKRLATHSLSTLAPGAWPDDYDRSVAVTLFLAVEAADQLEPIGLAKPLLAVLSLLDPNGIPVRLVTSAPMLTYLGSSAGMWVAADQAWDALMCLSRLNIITTVRPAGEPNRGTAGERIRVHALNQRAARDQMPPEAVASAARVAADGLVEIWPEVERDTELARALRANTLALRAVAEDYLWRSPDLLLIGRAGRSLGEAGLVANAVEYFHSLLAESTRRLGPDHPSTLTTRGNLAGWRGESGAVSAAIEESEELLADVLRVLGPDHPYTLTTRGNLAEWRGESGDVAGAIDDFAALLADVVRVLGPDHSDGLATRGNLVRWRGVSGDVAEAIRESVALLADVVRVFGPDHTATLTTRGNLVRWRGEAGDLAGAVGGSAALLADVLRVLGPDHPATLTARHELAYWRGKAGDVAGAIGEFAALFADRLRVLGPDHPDTLATRHNLARWRGVAGDGSGAIGEFATLLADRLRVLGPEHPDTLSTKYNLVYWRALAESWANDAPEPATPSARRRRGLWRWLTVP